MNFRRSQRRRLKKVDNFKNLGLYEILGNFTHRNLFTIKHKSNLLDERERKSNKVTPKSNKNLV